MARKQKEVKWAHCNRCNGSTKHDLLFVENVVVHDDVDQYVAITYWDDYSLLKCMGCNTVHLSHESSFSEALDNEGHPEVTKVIYPPRISRKKPAWLGDFSGPFWGGDTVIEQILDEIYAAMHNDSIRLATMGVRSLLEHIMVEQVGDQGGIAANIKKFFEAGYVAPKDQEVFRTKLVEAGHAAMHRNYKPNPDDFGVLLDLTEALVASVYVHPIRAKELEKKIPPRKAPTAKKS